MESPYVLKIYKKATISMDLAATFLCKPEVSTNGSLYMKIEEVICVVLLGTHLGT
jgi:hypothetical protein